MGYELFTDNFYTSPILLTELLQYGIVSTGTLNVTRKHIPTEVVTVKKMAEKRTVSRGTGYYFRKEKTDITYCVWHDTKTVLLASTAYAGHSESSVKQRVKDAVTNESVKKDVPCPIMLMKYNKSMGGVDKSDQYISYHNILRKTSKYWKTCFYHLVDIAVVNSHILYNWIQVENGEKVLSVNQFRDALILQIITTYGNQIQPTGKPRFRSCKVQHGSHLFSAQHKARCVYCSLHHKASVTQRKCPDCPLRHLLFARH